jgi:hypothetical protein
VSRLDVSARLAEGRAAVEHTQNYVWACHVLGYQHPDLTAHGSQVRDWYGSEDGLDLFALDADCANLWAAVHEIEEALVIERAQLTYLAGAWNGAAADAAMESLQQHCNSANAVVDAIRVAAEGCTALRDNLWQMVDAKVAAVVDIDDRRLTERAAWLPAAQLVTSGAGDQQAAYEMVERQVKPYVDNDIRNDWLTTMRSALAWAETSYDTLTEALTAAPAVGFQAAAGLIDRPLRDGPMVPTASAPVEPAAAIAPPAPAITMPAAAATHAPPDNTMPAAAATHAPPVPPALPADLLTGLPPMPPMSALDAPLADPAGLSSVAGDLGDLGDLGGLRGGGGPCGLGGGGGLGSGLGGGLGGLVGLAGQIVDAIGGLVGSLTDGLAGPSAPDDLLRTDDPLGDALNPDDRVADAADTDDDHDDDAGDTDDDDDDDAAAEPLETDADPQKTGTGTDTGEGTEDTAPEPQGKIPPAPPGAADPPTGQDGTPSPVEEPAAASAPAEPVAPAPQEEGSTPCEIAADALPQAGQ